MTMNIVKGMIELVAMIAGAAFVLLLSFQIYLWVRLGTWVPVTPVSVVGQQGMAWVDHFTVQVLRDVFIWISEMTLLVPLAVVSAGSWLGVKAMNRT